MIVTYEGTDITEEVTIERCVYEACELGRMPWLSVEFQDDAGVWDRWSPKVGDRISVVEEGIAATGAMYIDVAEPMSGGYSLHATALPALDLRAVREWRETTLFTVMRQLSTVLGLGFETHGCSDMALSFARQDDETAIAVLTRLAIFAGCTIDAYDGTLHLCSREWVEAKQPVGVLTLGDESDYAYTRKAFYASCAIKQPESPNAMGLSEDSGAGDPRLALVLDGSIAFPGSAELRRACAGALAAENAARSVGYARGNTLTPYTPGSTCMVRCDKTPSLAGGAVVTRIRNDFADQTSKTWWRSL